MGEFCRNNLKFNTSKEEQRQAHEFLEKIGRGQALFVALLIKNFLTSCGVESPDELTAKDVKKMVSSFQKLMEPEVDYMQRMIDSGQYWNTKKTSPQSVTDYQEIKAEVEDSRQSATDYEKEKQNTPLDKQSVTDYEEDVPFSEETVLSEEEKSEEEEENMEFDFAQDLMAQLSAFGN